MADQVLSQDEIDALLTSMGKGEIDLEKEKNKTGEVKLYDFSSQSIMLREQFYALEEVYDKFSRNLKITLSSLLQNPIEAEFVTTEMIKFKEFIQAFSDPTSFNIFTMDPLIGSGLLVIETNLVFSFVDCLMGGQGKPMSKVRDFTAIEIRMMNKVVRDILMNMEKSWSYVQNIKIETKSNETNPIYVRLVSPSDMVVTIVFSINSKEFSGNIHFCIPYIMLEPLKEQLSNQQIRSSEFSNKWTNKIQNLLYDTRVIMTADLGKITDYNIRDLLNVKQGNKIRLDYGPQDPIVVNVSGIPKYMGFPGVVKGNRAVQISSLLKNN
jgi:flagellar motor switch protein FliM